MCTSLLLTHSHTYRCALRENEWSLLASSPLISFHTLLMGPELSCVSLGWALFDSWGWMRGVATHAMNCFLFLLKGSSEARGDHRRGWRAAAAHPVRGAAATAENIHQTSKKLHQERRKKVKGFYLLLKYCKFTGSEREECRQWDGVCADTWQQQLPTSHITITSTHCFYSF